MAPQWTRPLDLSAIAPTPTPTPTSPAPAPPPKPLAAASFDFESQFRDSLHDVPPPRDVARSVRAAQARFRSLHERARARDPPPRVAAYPRPCLHPAVRLLVPKPRPRLLRRLNRPHSPPPALDAVPPPVKSEFMRVSTVAARTYAVPPDPADEHDHSIFEFPSVLPRRHSPARDDLPQPVSLQEPSRTNIRHLIERYNNHNSHPTTSHHTITTATTTNNVTTTSTQSPTSSSMTHPEAQPQFTIQSVRDIFERHTTRLPNTDISLSSITDSPSPSTASKRLHAPQPLQDNRPQRIAFADLTNTLDLSPCASSTSDPPDERQVPVVTPPPDASPTVLLPERFASTTRRKKSFSVFSKKSSPVEQGRARSFAQGERFAGHGRWSSRRFTTADKTKKRWISMHLRACGGSVRRRLESFRNMISADDY